MFSRKYFRIAVLLLPFALSCGDFLDKEPDDTLTQKMIFEDRRRVEEWLARCYNLVPDLVGMGENMVYSNLSDDSFISIELAQWINPFPISARQGNWSPLSNMGFDLWNDTYRAIRSALIFIEEVKPLPDQALTAERVESMKMEARFLIAYYYSRLISFYGAVPLVTQLFASDLPVEELMLARTPFDQLVDHLDQELLQLSEYFPVRVAEENNQFGRPTKGICLAVRARLLMIAASPLFNGNPDFTDVVNNDGTPLFSSAVDEMKWQRAAAACRSLLDLAETGAYNLYIKRHSNGSIDPFLSFRDLFLTTAETNKEIIFARPQSDYVNGVKMRYPRGAGGNAFMGATQNLVDQFFMKNGLPIWHEQSGYAESGYTESPIFYENTAYDVGNASRTPGLVVDQQTFNMYANREPRFYVSIRYNDQFIPSVGRKTQYKNGGMDGRPSHDSPQTGYHSRKGVSDEDRPLEGNFSYRPGTIMRLAEFYLNYAEALNEYDPGNPDILKYIDLVRERAGIPGIDPTILGRQDSMRQVIRQERRVEFSCEGEIRYNDMRRWKISEQVFGLEPTIGTNPYGTSDAEFYKRTVIMRNIFTKKMYLWPINQKYMDNNPNLVQNKFW